MRRITHIHIVLTLGLGLTLALLWLLSSPGVRLPSARAANLPRLAAAPGNVYCVTLDGGDSYPGCTQVFTSVQAAVDFAAGGETIKVATGVYTDVHSRYYHHQAIISGSLIMLDTITQVVYISRTVTIQGGYTTTNWTTPYPITQPTTLDAQGRGRVLYITRTISPTIEGLRLTGGNAKGLGGCPVPGSPLERDGGGGIYAIGAHISLSNNQVFGNIGSSSNQYSSGGGLYIFGGYSILSNNQVFSNTADGGGGLYIFTGSGILDSNVFSANTAIVGGGLCVYGGIPSPFYPFLHADVPEINLIINGNTFIANTAERGGGLALENMPGWSSVIISHITTALNGNVITANAAKYGGGIALRFSDATLTNNIISDNHGDVTGSGLSIDGGVCSLTIPKLLHTTIVRNSGGDGSGVCITSYYCPENDTIVLTNTILVNHTIGVTATAGTTVKLNGVLWYSNTTANTGGAGTILVTHALTGDPAFASDGYHLTTGSAAINKGVDSGVLIDIDGEARPDGCLFDIGADEFMTGIECPRVYLPLVLRPSP